jgi:sigma-E factor negative regulatory protein RseC
MNLCKFIFFSQLSIIFIPGDNNMIETGIVKSLNGINARVLISRQSGPCDHCTQETCTIPEKGIETEAINTAGAKVGQKVKIVMKSYTYIKGTFLVYILPVVALITGAVLGKLYLPSFFTGADSDLLAAGAGFSAFLASLIVVKLILNRMDRRSETKSVIESTVEE